ncbi:MAG: peptide chain release factor 2, partial [Neisseria sp.]|nr:peptide chain release factor 2 [Neisseria sp.]
MEAEVINQLNNTLNDLEKRSEDIRVYMDYQGKKDRLEEVIGLSEDPELW